MLKLYYAPGACSTGSHIALEELGVAYSSAPVALAKGEQRTPDYLAINPRGKVPALDTGSGVITENVAILSYLGGLVPDRGLLPADPVGQARCVSHLAWLSNSVHPCFSRFNRPERFADDAAAHASVKAGGKAAFWGMLQEIDGLLNPGPWVLGDCYSVADPYTLVFYAWGRRAELPMTELTHYTAFKDRMLARPAVRTVLEREKSPLLAA
jgi:glutathione S-transferase